MLKSSKKPTMTLITVSALASAFLVASACADRQAKAKANIVVKDAPRPGVVAKIGGEEITEDALVGEDKLDFFELKKREYDLKMDRVNKLLIERLIGGEAKKAGLSTDDFINKKVVGGDIKITEKEVKKFIEEKHIPESQLNPQIRERINSYLQSMKRQDMIQAYIAKLTKGAPVEVYFAKPKMNVQVELGNAPTAGGEKAKVTIVEFSDFQCPFCARGAETLAAVKKKYGNKVKIAFKNFPLPMHREARPAHEAAMCVNEQSSDKFWKYHDRLFKSQDKLDDASLEKYVGEVGADVKKFQECYKAKKFANFVSDDLAYGEKIGVKSTPTFFINGQIVSGALPIESFSEIIDEELASK